MQLNEFDSQASFESNLQLKMSVAPTFTTVKQQGFIQGEGGNLLSISFLLNENFEITSFISRWQIAKGGRGTLFYSRIAVNDAKGRRVQ